MVTSFGNCFENGMFSLTLDDGESLAIVDIVPELRSGVDAIESIHPAVKQAMSDLCRTLEAQDMECLIHNRLITLAYSSDLMRISFGGIMTYAAPQHYPEKTAQLIEKTYSDLGRFNSLELYMPLKLSADEVIAVFKEYKDIFDAWGQAVGEASAVLSLICQELIDVLDMMWLSVPKLPLKPDKENNSRRKTAAFLQERILNLRRQAKENKKLFRLGHVFARGYERTGILDDPDIHTYGLAQLSYRMSLRDSSKAYERLIKLVLLGSNNNMDAVFDEFERDNGRTVKQANEIINSYLANKIKPAQRLGSDL